MSLVIRISSAVTSESHRITQTGLQLHKAGNVSYRVIYVPKYIYNTYYIYCDDGRMSEMMDVQINIDQWSSVLEVGTKTCRSILGQVVERGRVKKTVC